MAIHALKFGKAVATPQRNLTQHTTADADTPKRHWEALKKANNYERVETSDQGFFCGKVKKTGAKKVGSPPITRTGYVDGKEVDIRLSWIGPSIWMEMEAARNFQEMQEAAARDGVTLTPDEGFRTYERQKELYEENPDIAKKPGYSRHQAGTAVDIELNPENHFWIGPKKDIKTSKEYQWLKENAHKYGFIADEFMANGTHEAWHWAYVGKEAAEAYDKSAY